ncbi:MAG: NAD(P)/FAD-dependent oxidoreductase [Elusimicrobia bacterium]|nr:NAD(P)/FAD-dependent oxidoreductase [Elusimicrobiota bacterium]
MNSSDVIVIGAGASGLIAAGVAAQKYQNVLLLEKKTRPAIKLSITGKGRCNVTNSADLQEFVKEFGNNGKFLYSAFSKFFNTDTIAFFEELGVKCRLERGGRYFPESNDAHDIVNALIKFVKNNNVKIITGSEVTKFVFKDKKIESVLLKNGTQYSATKFILATGGKSYPLTGSTGDGYNLAKSAGHTIIKPQPALVPLVSDDKNLKQLNKLKLKNIEISVIADEKAVAKLFGEIEFTVFGLTGPLILTVSSQVFSLLEQKKSIDISVNLKPALDDKQLDDRLVRELNSFGNNPVRNMLKTLLPMQMIEPFMKKNNIKWTETCSAINKEKRKKIFDGLRQMKFKIVSTRPIDEAIITKGGISLKEVEQNTMKSKLIENLYFCGEILDIDGPTGGFNLQAAFSTGYLAGQLEG